MYFSSYNAQFNSPLYFCNIRIFMLIIDSLRYSISTNNNVIITICFYFTIMYYPFKFASSQSSLSIIINPLIDRIIMSLTLFVFILQLCVTHLIYFISRVSRYSYLYTTMFNISQNEYKLRNFYLYFNIQQYYSLTTNNSTIFTNLIFADHIKENIITNIY